MIREFWVIEEQNDDGEWYVIFCGGKITAEEELARWPSTPENPKRIVRYVPKRIVRYVPDTTAPQEEP